MLASKQLPVISHPGAVQVPVPSDTGHAQDQVRGLPAETLHLYDVDCSRARCWGSGGYRERQSASAHQVGSRRSGDGRGTNRQETTGGGKEGCRSTYPEQTMQHLVRKGGKTCRIPASVPAVPFTSDCDLGLTHLGARHAEEEGDPAHDALRSLDRNVEVLRSPSW